jgi:hypothetical protein
LLRNRHRDASIWALQGKEGHEGYLMFIDREEWQDAERELKVWRRVFPTWVAP